MRKDTLERFKAWGGDMIILVSNKVEFRAQNCFGGLGLTKQLGS